ncbi:hypothetical protein RIF29_23866 [Crotalaria pallida]|uniref:Nodule inception protein n=1 Tax=Crotalaria pallida TaxID=3830 RepID=A0AAN9HW13_CROPI
MEYGGALMHSSSSSSSSSSGVFGSFFSSDTEVAADFTDELLSEGCWVETTAGGGGRDHEEDEEEEEGEGGVVGKRWWIGPAASRENPSVKERLVVAVGYLKDHTNNNNNNVFIQIWVPQRRTSPFDFEFHHHRTHRNEVMMMTTPNSNTNNTTNVNVRFLRSPRPTHYYEVQQYDGRGGCLALPVFERGTATCLGVLEINNVVIPPPPLQNLINYRPPPPPPQQLIIDNNNLSITLEAAAADFRSCQNFIPSSSSSSSSVKVFDELYQAALNEIVEVLTSVCKTHNLPLALTWAPCIQQGKCGCGHSSSTTSSDQNYVYYCVSTVDSACFVADVDMLGFQEACSEYHLFRGQGIVGTAFATAKPCFAIDITAFSKAEYPLAHHAKMFGLHAAVAIPLRSVYTGSADFVLEFFLPKDCHDTEQQRHMLNSLSMLVQQACRSLHVVTEDEFSLPPHNNKEEEQAAAHVDHIHKLLFESTQPSQAESSSSWIAHMMEAQQKGKGVSVSLEYQLEEPKEEFKVTTNWDGSNYNELQAQATQVFSEFTEHSSGSRSRASTVELTAGTGGGGEECYSFSGRRSSSTTTNSVGGGRKTGEKRRTKAEKTISLPVLRQYFAGSLKDAAKSIGVCPTTLKRICRQHGITRWPSRKIKKVGHSLKKLQLVIDSVQGAEGAIQIGSFYTSFPELCSASSARPDSSNKMHTYPKTECDNNINNNNGLYGDACSQNFGPTTLTSAGNLAAASTMINTNKYNNGGGVDVVMMSERISPDDHAIFLSREAAELSIQEKSHFTRSKAAAPPPLPSGGCGGRGAFRVKATFEDEKIRFSLQPNWGFRELEVEIARRFNLNDVSSIDLKYLDDEGEWVVLGCDADLEECKDLHRTSQGRTIRLSLFQASSSSSPVNHHHHHHHHVPNNNDTFGGISSNSPSSS